MLKISLALLVVVDCFQNCLEVVVGQVSSSVEVVVGVQVGRDMERIR